MAASFGERALAEVHEAGLDQLLNELSEFYPASIGKRLLFGVPIIDDLLKVFMQRPSNVSTDAETGQMQNTVSAETILTEDDEVLLRCSQDDQAIFGGEDLIEMGSSSNSPTMSMTTTAREPVPVVEISSSLSGAGKTQLLYHMVAKAILPRRFLNVDVGGLETAVVWIDTDDRLDVHRLQLVARAIFHDAWKDVKTENETENLGHLSDSQVSEVLTLCLQHVHVFRPQSSTALLATLAQLDHYLYDLSRHYSASRRLHTVIIDSATAFLWQDKLRDDIARTDEIGQSRMEIEGRRQLKQSFHLSDLYADIVSELKRLQDLFGCAIVYTTTVSSGRFSTSTSSGPPGLYDRPPTSTPSLRPALPAPWGLFPTLRLVVHRGTVRPFPPAMSAHDARKDASMRQGIVQQGKFSAWVNAWGQEDWPRRVVDGVHWHNGGCFSFYVRATGVEIPTSYNG
ncbi:hypothetical protein N7539_007984 [Penicillium diatomitis]|uniref:DNA recombination and repair protein Rad51-like C-terminal domain-containing protein n=1 Tax=Penicillium diatomitis TaxID=2819901 RepID=A0A9W9WUE2_9EURO|nr:uncharacterized protein N7539_007984 [Penicillium diatomitis]KAJ5475697.1 hypothetical protein N7539_007984 [Penicillium diatomitis]